MSKLTKNVFLALVAVFAVFLVRTAIYLYKVMGPREIRTFSSDELAGYEPPVVFLETEGKEGIYEYDMSQEKYRCLIEEDSVCTYLNLSQDSVFKSVYYYFDEGTISFLYGDYLIIYDAYGEEFVYSTPLVLGMGEDVYGWLTPQTLLMATGKMKGESVPIYEVNIYTQERKQKQQII